MKPESFSKPSRKSLVSGLKISVTAIIVIMVISSPVFILTGPIQVSAAATIPAAAAGNPNGIDTSAYHSNMPTTSSTTPPTSTMSQDGDFTTQAALTLTRASQTNNFVASKAYYDISFRTATAGAIKTVQMNFPAGTAIGSALLVEATGIGPGTISAISSQILEYTVTNAVNVPANTIIRIQISNINNPPTPSGSFTVSITTRNAANVIIDGPTPTSAYNMVQVGNAQIAPGAVTTTKIATGAVTSGDTSPSFIRSKQLSAGQNGWEPNGSENAFSISDPSINANSHIFAGTGDIGTGSVVCGEEGIIPGFGFELACSGPPSDVAELRYTVIDQPNT
jgi:hypothetical protein